MLFAIRVLVELEISHSSKDSLSDLCLLLSKEILLLCLFFYVMMHTKGQFPWSSCILENKAGYETTPIACGWAEVVFEIN